MGSFYDVKLIYDVTDSFTLQCLDIGLLCPNMEIRPQAPKNEIFQNIFTFLKMSSDFASNELSTTCSFSQVMKKTYYPKRLSLGLNFSTPSREKPVL